MADQSRIISVGRFSQVPMLIEALLIGGHQVVFEGCFENTNGVQMVTRLSYDIGHCLYLQGLLIYLGDEWRTT